MQKTAQVVLPEITIAAGETTDLSDSNLVSLTRSTELTFTLKATYNALSSGGLVVYIYTSLDNAAYDDYPWDIWPIPNCRGVGFTLGTKSWIIGETVTSGSGGTGIVTGWTVDAGSFSGGDAAGTVYLEDISGTFADGDTLTGSENGSATESGTTQSHSVVRTYAPVSVVPMYMKVRVCNKDTSYSATAVSVWSTKQTL